MDQESKEDNVVEDEVMETTEELQDVKDDVKDEEHAPLEELSKANESLLPPTLISSIKEEQDDSDSSSSSSSSSSSPSMVLEGHDNDDIEDFSKPAIIKTKDEILLEEFPSVEEVNVILPEEAELRPVGTVSSIVQQLVVVKSIKDSPALTEDSIIFRSDRLALGKVFEIFGPVSSPLYLMCFNTLEEITNKGLIEGQIVYYAPDIKEYTGYILTQQLQLLRGSDASWKNDQEPPSEALDYSDDEKEQEAKRKSKNSRRKNNNEDNPAQKPQHPVSHGAKGSFHPAGPQFRHQHTRNTPAPYGHSLPPPAHFQPPPMYLPPPCMYNLPPPPPNFHLYPPPPHSFFNPSYHHPFWPSNSSPYLEPPAPPPPPTE